MGLVGGENGPLPSDFIKREMEAGRIKFYVTDSNGKKQLLTNPPQGVRLEVAPIDSQPKGRGVTGG